MARWPGLVGRRTGRARERGDPSELTCCPAGRLGFGPSWIAQQLFDNSGTPPGNGALFGLALKPHQAGIYYVDDAVNTLRLLH